MKVLETMSRFVSKYFTVLVILLAGFAYFVPLLFKIKIQKIRNTLDI